MGHLPLSRHLSRHLSQGTPLRFLLVGGCLALVYSALAALATTTLPLPAPLVAVLVWMACIPPAYWCQKRFTFGASAARRGGLAIYAATQALGMAIVAIASLLLATGRLVPDMLIYLAASALSAAVSYLVNRLVIFPARAEYGIPRR